MSLAPVVLFTVDPPMPGVSRSLNGLFSFLGGRRLDPSAAGVEEQVPANEPLHPTKAFGKFLRLLQTRENPALIDLGPVVGSNVTFFGEHLGCRIRVEDLAEDLERHVQAGTLDQLPVFLHSRFQQPAESVDGVLCWDLFDYLDRPAAEALAGALTRLLRPEGALLGFFSTSEARSQVYTKYIVVDESSFRYRTYPATRPRQRSLLNRDIIRLFDGLRVTDSFLMKTHMREILFRKPAYLSR